MKASPILDRAARDHERPADDVDPAAPRQGRRAVQHVRCGVSSSLAGSSVVERNLDRYTVLVGVVWFACIVGLGFWLKFVQNADLSCYFRVGGTIGIHSRLRRPTLGFVMMLARLSRILGPSGPR